MTKWLQGPPPWEDNHLYHIVNNYHLKAAEKFRSMDKYERRLAAKDRLSELQVCTHVIIKNFDANLEYCFF